MIPVESYLLLRTTEYSDDALRLSKHSIDLGPPRPSAGEGLGVRGSAHNWSFSQAFQILIQGQVSGDWRRGIPPHPQAPLPRWGRGEPMLTTVLYQTSWQKCHYNLESSIVFAYCDLSWMYYLGVGNAFTATGGTRLIQESS